MLKPHMVVLLNQNILHGELLSPRPAHYGVKDLEALFVGERDGTVHGEAAEGPKREGDRGLA